MNTVFLAEIPLNFLQVDFGTIHQLKKCSKIIFFESSLSAFLKTFSLFSKSFKEDLSIFDFSEMTIENTIVIFSPSLKNKINLLSNKYNFTCINSSITNDFKPLNGSLIISTRSYEQSLDFTLSLKVLGADVVCLPMIKIKPINLDILKNYFSNISIYDWVLFTSSNSVRIFFNTLISSDYDLRILSGLNFAVIGSKTAIELENFGFKADLQPNKFVAESLVSSFKSINAKRVLFPKAKITRGVIESEFPKLGINLDSISIYENTPEENIYEKSELFDFMNRKYVYFVFTSPSTVVNFYKGFKTFPRYTKLISIGPVTAKKVEDLFNVASLQPIENTFESIIETIYEDYLSTNS